MSDFQIGLIALGVVIVLGVLAYNWWQDRSVRKRMQAQFPQTEEDPLLGGLPPVVGRKEPGLTDGVAGVSHEVTHTRRDVATEPDEVDAVCEAVIDIVFTQPVQSGDLAEAAKALIPADVRPLRYFSELPDGTHCAGLPAGEACASLQIAVLLANRSGPMTDIEWSQLWTAAQALAEKFDGAVEGPEQDDVVAQAAALDAMCAGLDAQVGLALQLPSPVQVARVRDTVIEAGFARVGAHMAWVAESGAARFTLMFDGSPVSAFLGDRVGRLDLLLDLPNSPADAQAFSRMASVGRDLAQRLDAVLVDDQGRPVSEASDATIDKQLAAMYAQLTQAGFAPGSERTARLFS